MDTAVLVRALRQARLDGHIVDRAHTDYDRFRRVWNAVANRRPAVIVRAQSVADVKSVVAIAAKHDALLAVRGGGHSIPGLSTCDDGIVLDLSPMNAVSVDRSAGSADVLGGALLGDLDRAGAAAGLVVPAGVVSHTGVAGLTLGGGMGWLSRRLGLTIDSLIAVDLVTADARARSVSEETDPDLFWAIRGGGGNFGVVTGFRFRMHRLERVAIGSWVYPTAEAGAALRRYRDLAAEAPRELSTGVVLTSAELLITAVWTGSPANAERALEPYGALGRARSASIGDMTFLELQTRSDDRFAWRRRYYAKGGYLREVDERALERMVGAIDDAPSPDAEISLLQLGGAVSDLADDATAYTGRDAGYYWIVESAWDDRADDERFISWSRVAAGRLTEISMQGNYVNEQGDFGREIALGAYGETKYERLAALKARYDPRNLFRLNQNIEPRPDSGLAQSLSC